MSLAKSEVDMVTSFPSCWESASPGKGRYLPLGISIAQVASNVRTAGIHQWCGKFPVGVGCVYVGKMQVRMLPNRGQSPYIPSAVVYR